MKGILLVYCVFCWNVCLCAGTLAFWRLDPRGGGVDLTDASGTNHLISSAGGVQPSFRRPLALVPGWEAPDASSRGARQNEGSVFIGGGQGAYLKAPGLGARLDACGAFTIEGWLRQAGGVPGKATRCVFGTSSWALMLQEDNGAARLFLRDSAGAGDVDAHGAFADSGLSNGYGWKHVALTRKVAGDQAAWELYVGGVGCGTVTTGVSRNRAGAPEDLFVGGRPGADASFHGQIDLWRVSDAALKPADFLAAHAPNVLAYWPLDSSAQGGAECKDISGAGNHLAAGRDGGVSGAAVQAVESLPWAGALNLTHADIVRNIGSIQLVGSLGRRSLLKAPGLGLRCDLTNSFTVEGWFKKDGDPADRFWILAGARDASNGWMLALHEDGGRTRFYLFVSDVAKGGRLQFERFFPNADVTADSSWRHVALVYDHMAVGKGAWQIYLDGVWQSSIVNPAAPDRSHGFADFMLGGRDSFSNSFVGWLDAWRVTDGPLAAEQLLCARPDAQPRTPPMVFDDARNLERGLKADVFGTCRQPFFMINREGHWIGLAVTETACGDSAGRRLVSAVSRDKGRTWSLPAVIESGDMPDQAWVNGLVTPFGRVYAFYGVGGGVKPQADKAALKKVAPGGGVAYRYSDDNGQSWSRDRHLVLFRFGAEGRFNAGQVGLVAPRFDGKPALCEQAVFFAVTGMPGSSGSEGGGWAALSDNILSERNAGLVRFSLLSEGGAGIVGRGGSGKRRAAHLLTALSGGELLCVFSEGGEVAQSVSRDSGKSWSKPEPMVCGPGRRGVKSAGMAPRLFRTSAGRHLLCVSDRDEFSGELDAAVTEVFVCGGVEKGDGAILWSEPELLLHGGGPAQACSVADMLEQEGRFWVTAVCGGRVSLAEVRAELLSGLFGDSSGAAPCRAGMLSEWMFQGSAPAAVDLPSGFGAAAGGGFSIEMRLALDQLDDGTVLFSSFDGRRGVKVDALKRSGGVTLRLSLFDGDLAAMWQTGKDAVRLSEPRHVVFICDYAAGLVSAVVDGCAGAGETNGGRRWSLMPAEFGPVASSRRKAQVGRGVMMLRLFDRALRVAEASGGYHCLKER